jgi:hypothetical protein
MSTDPSSWPAGREPRPPSPIEALLGRVEVELPALRSDLFGAEQARKRANRINVGILAVLAIFVAMVLVIGWQNNKVLGQVQQTNNRVADCTTAGGRCYEDGRQRTGAAISTLTRISIYVSQCGRLFPGESGPQYDAKIEACVAERLARAQTQTPPSPSPGASAGPR